MAIFALVAASRRPAAMPAAPAPMIATSSSPGSRAASAEVPAEATEAADAARNWRRLNEVMGSHLLNEPHHAPTQYGSQIACRLASATTDTGSLTLSGLRQ